MPEFDPPDEREEMVGRMAEAIRRTKAEIARSKALVKRVEALHDGAQPGKTAPGRAGKPRRARKPVKSA